MGRFRRAGSAAWMFAAAWGTGCAGSGIQVSRNPAADLNATRTVAVLPFGNDASDRRIAGEWQALLLSCGYRVVERGDVSKLLGEQGLSVSGAVDPDQAPKIGAVLGVDGLVLGMSNPRKPYHYFGMGGGEHVAEPPPTSVKLVDLKTARVVWNVTAPAQHEGDVSMTQGTSAVDAAVRHDVERLLDTSGWTHRSDGTGVSAAGAVMGAARTAAKSRRMRIGVYPFTSGSEKQDGRAWADKAGAALLQSGYDLIDRSQLERVFAEQALSLSGAIRPEDMAKAGKVAGLQGVVFGTVYGNAVCAWSATLVDATSGEVLWACYGEDCEMAGLSGSLAKASE